MKDPCPTCDGDGFLGTSPDSPPCPECMGGASLDPVGDEMSAWEGRDGAEPPTSLPDAERTPLASTFPQALHDYTRLDAERVARNQDADRKIESEAADCRQWTEKTLETGTPDERHALLDDFVARGKACVFSPEGNDGEPSLVPGVNLGQLRKRREARILGTAAEGTACRDAAQGDAQDWEDVSVAERAAIRRAVDKFRSLAEPARKSAAGARSDPATQPATISSTGPAVGGDFIPPSAAVSPRGAR